MTATAYESVRTVLSLEDVDELIADRGLRTPAFRMARGGKLINPGRYTHATGSDTAHSAPQFADADGIAEQIGRGSTLVLQGLQRFHPPAGRLARALGGDLGARVFVNAYLTPGSAQGFAEHCDPYGAFLVQLVGAKQWRIRPSSNVPKEDITLRPLDVLWLPEGWLHEGVALPGNPSIHLTLAVDPLPLTDIVAAITESLTQQVHGEVLPPLGEDAEQVLEREVDRLTARLHAALDDIEAKDLVRTLLARIAHSGTASTGRVSTALGLAPAAEVAGSVGTDDGAS